jgi:hypothetical protein
VLAPARVELVPGLAVPAEQVRGPGPALEPAQEELAPGAQARVLEPARVLVARALA